MSTEPNCRNCPSSRLRLVDVGHRVEALCCWGGVNYAYIPLGPTDARGIGRIRPHGECREWEGRTTSNLTKGGN